MIFTDDHQLILIIHDFFCSSSEVVKSILMCPNHVVCSKGLLLPLSVFITGMGKNKANTVELHSTIS